MNIKRICLLIVAMIFCANLETFAQKKSDTGIGKVDLYVLLLLHPDMINYNIEKQAFSVTRDESSKQKAKNERDANKKEIEELEFQMGDLKARITETEKNYMKKIDAAKKAYIEEIAELATAPAAIRKISFKQILDNEEAVHHSVMSALTYEYSSLEDKIMRLKEFGFSESFTTPDETNKRFESIIKETNDYIQKIAKQKNITIVFNSGYKKLMRKSSDNSRNKRIFHKDNSLSAIFESSFPQELMEDKLGIKGYYEGLNNRTIAWLNSGEPIINRMRANLVNTDIIIGGTDLTKDVLEALYKAYKLDPNISTAVIQSAIKY